MSEFPKIDVDLYEDYIEFYENRQKSEFSVATQLKKLMEKRDLFIKQVRALTHFIKQNTNNDANRYASENLAMFAGHNNYWYLFVETEIINLSNALSLKRARVDDEPDTQPSKKARNHENIHKK